MHRKVGRGGPYRSIISCLCGRQEDEEKNVPSAADITFFCIAQLMVVTE